MHTSRAKDKTHPTVIEYLESNYRDTSAARASDGVKGKTFKSEKSRIRFMGELSRHKNIKQTNYFEKMMYTFIKCSVTQNSVSLEGLVTNQGIFLAAPI